MWLKLSQLYHTWALHYVLGLRQQIYNQYSANIMGITRLSMTDVVIWLRVSSIRPVVIFRYLTSWLDGANRIMFVLIVLVICRTHTTTHAATHFDAIDQGMTEIPKDIPCEIQKIFLHKNFITRVEADSFPCHVKTFAIRLQENDLIFIDRDAFQFCFSLLNLFLGRNPRLQHLPPSFGPNTANMKMLYLQYLDLQSLPYAYFRQFESLIYLGIPGWGINSALENDVLNGLANVQYFFTGCCSSTPNMTGHFPVLEKLVFHGLPEERIPNENMYGLYMLRVIINPPCSFIPVFEGAVRLQSVDARHCEVTDLPDLSQHRALKKFKVSTAHFQCNSKCCWMLYEDISTQGLDWILSITCNGPHNLGGYKISNITTLQARCFESKSVYWLCHVCIKRCTLNIIKIKYLHKAGWSNLICRPMTNIVKKVNARRQQ